jgi:molybdate transport system substrate-binding protein
LEKECGLNIKEKAMKKKQFGCLAVCVLLLTLVIGMGRPAWAKTESITVFAAASTTNALTDIAALYEKKHPVKIRLSFASSSTLAKQIENGAPADIYLSANPKWMNYLAEKGFIVTESRRDLLGNSLVLIVPADSPIDRLQVDAGLDLAGILGQGRLSMGDPDHVPAGMYGKNAMQQLGFWDAIADRRPGPRMSGPPWSWWNGGSAPWDRSMPRMRPSVTKCGWPGIFPLTVTRPLSTRRPW